MSDGFHICLGTAGWGLWHSPDAGTSWTRHRHPFPLNSRVQALAVDPSRPHTVYAGGDTGLFVSHDAGASWEKRNTQTELPTIWSLAVDPVDPMILFAGTRPAGIYRSHDGGREWEQCSIDVTLACSIGTPFVTSLIVDPDDHLTVWAGVEIDGVFCSQDGGESWKQVARGLDDPDIHDLAVAGTNPPRLIASTARDMFSFNSTDSRWRSWDIKSKWPLPYARGIAIKTDDPTTLFAGCGESTTGEQGRILRTTDFGETWQNLELPCSPNSTVWGFGTHPSNADRILAFSLFGQVFISEDAGGSWSKISRDFGEIRTLAWLPH